MRSSQFIDQSEHSVNCVNQSQLSNLRLAVHILQPLGQADHEGLILLPVLALPPHALLKSLARTHVHLLAVALPPLPVALQVNGVMLGRVSIGGQVEKTVSMIAAAII